MRKQKNQVSYGKGNEISAFKGSYFALSRYFHFSQRIVIFWRKPLQHKKVASNFGRGYCPPVIATSDLTVYDSFPFKFQIVYDGMLGRSRKKTLVRIVTKQGWIFGCVKYNRMHLRSINDSAMRRIPFSYKRNLLYSLLLIWIESTLYHWG